MTCAEYEEWRREQEWLRHRDEYLKIDVEALLGTVNDYFEDLRESTRFAKEHPFYRRSDEEDRRARHLDDRLNGSDNRVCDICGFSVWIAAGWNVSPAWSTGGRKSAAGKNAFR